MSRTEIYHLIKVLGKGSGAEGKELWTLIEEDMFNKSYVQFLLNTPGTHMLEFIFDRSTEAICTRSDFRLALIYTHAYPMLRPLLLFMLWDDYFKDFDRKVHLLRFSTTSLQDKDARIVCMVEQLQFMLHLSLILERTVLKECRLNYVNAQHIYEIVQQQSWVGGVMKRYGLLPLMTHSVNTAFNLKVRESMPVHNLRLRSLIEWNLHLQNAFFTVKLLWELIYRQQALEYTAAKRKLQAVDESLWLLRANPRIYGKTLSHVLSLILSQPPPQ